MDDILYARSQMAMSLGFHIIFAAIGMTMPILMVVSEILWLKTRNAHYLQLAKNWAKGTAVLFAIGAVSGTILSFELGLLFPKFMEHAGPIIGIPFSLEGFAFFLEAIFLGIYLYGWNKIGAKAHIFAGIMVALSGLSSGAFVTLVNAWMNTPEGFDVSATGQLINIRPYEAIITPAAFHQVVHMLVSALMATGFAVAGLHSYLSLKSPNNEFHKKALLVALSVAVPFSLLQPFVGHLAAQRVAEYQPLKLAAMEGHFETKSHAPLSIGGMPDYESEQMKFALEIPSGLSILAFNNPNAEVKGLKDFPKKDWPLPVVHYAFQIMVSLGTYMAFVSAWCLAHWLRRRDFSFGPWLLKAIVLATPMGFIAIEAGWVTTEVGRQPWVIYNVLRTADSVTSMPGLAYPFWLFTALYIGLAVAVTTVLWRQIRLGHKSSLGQGASHP